MKKLLFVFFALLGISTFVFAGETNGNPFQALWDAIANLQEQITNIELIPGPVGPQGPQGETGPAGSQLHLFDANGQDLGILISAESNASYFRTYIPTERVFLNFDQSRNSSSISVTPTGTIYFTQQNCSGTPYAPGGNPHGAVITNGRLFRYTSGDGLNIPNTISALESSGCVNQSFGPGTIYPLEEISIPFTLPLTWPLEIR